MEGYGESERVGEGEKESERAREQKRVRDGETERDGRWNEGEKVLGSGLTEVVGDELGKVGEQGCKNGESEWHRRHLSPPQGL